MDFRVSFQTRQINDSLGLWDWSAAIPELFDKFFGMRQQIGHLIWPQIVMECFRTSYVTLMSLCRAVSVSQFFFSFSCLASLLAIMLGHTHFFHLLQSHRFCAGSKCRPLCFQSNPRYCHHVLYRSLSHIGRAPTAISSGALSSVSRASLVGKVTEKHAAIQWQARVGLHNYLLF